MGDDRKVVRFVPEPEEFRQSQKDPLADLTPTEFSEDMDPAEREIPSGLRPGEAADEFGDDEPGDPDDSPDPMRIEIAMAMYDEVRLVLESLHTIAADLDEPELDRWEMVRARAREHLEVAESALNDLGRLLQDLHLRPSEDSTDDAFLTPE